MEERLVLVKQLFLVEELHIRQHVEHQVFNETVPLRRQHVTIDRLDIDDHGHETSSKDDRADDVVATNTQFDRR